MLNQAHVIPLPGLLHWATSPVSQEFSSLLCLIHLMCSDLCISVALLLWKTSSLYSSTSTHTNIHTYFSFLSLSSFHPPAPSVSSFLVNSSEDAGKSSLSDQVRSGLQSSWGYHDNKHPWLPTRRQEPIERDYHFPGTYRVYSQQQAL